MPIDVANKAPGDDLFAREVNAMTRAIDGLLGTKGPNSIIDSSGVHQRKTAPKNVQTLFIAEVVAALGDLGGYYACKLQAFTSTDWLTSNADQFSDIGDFIVVGVVFELGSTDHSLSAGDKILCWNFLDDAGVVRFMGNPARASGSPLLFIAEIDSNATGGGYYNCHLQSLDATDWNTTTANQTDDIGGSVVVLNLAEIPVSGDTASHELSAGDKIPCWFITDDGGTLRLVGVAALRYTSCP